MTLHPLIRRAAEGEFPAWSRAGEARRLHMASVARLMGQWAESRGLSSEDRSRWRAAGLLHDVLRDAAPEELRSIVGPELADLPGPLLHGPAAARLLEGEGVGDGPLLLSIAFHTLGHPDLDELGCALYAADFLEPGRDHLSEVEAELRDRMVKDPEGVVLEVALTRVSQIVKRRRPLRSESVRFWNRLTATRALPSHRGTE
ncbi:MAG: HD domain-containing protein [Gemmatimonadetes bacterium]|nr:HD domain-containing protein [Gemmatimonadota bacterium]